jgi:hypothetical protein
MTTPNTFPILAFRRDAGDEVLLGYQLSAKEKEVFLEMDEATLSIAEDSDLDAYYQIIIPIGERHGLSAQEAIAFWTRATFSIFES